MAGGPELWDCVFGRWQPEIGDPTVMGWLTVLAYLAAFWLAARVAVAADRFPPATRGRERVFWAGLALLLLGLAVNKELDLQSLMTAIGRCMARRDGWYENRAAVQKAFLLGLALGVLVGLAVLARLLRGTLRRNALAVAGTALLLGFVVMRAVGFHGMDEMLDLRLLGLRLNWVFELGAIAIVMAGAASVLARPPAPGPYRATRRLRR